MIPPAILAIIVERILTNRLCECVENLINVAGGSNLSNSIIDILANEEDFWELS